MYQVNISNYLGCKDSFSTFVDYHFIPQIYLKDTFINCFVDQPLFKLNVKSDSFNCHWEGFSYNTCELQTDVPGRFKLMAVSKSSDCKSEKSIVLLDQCEALVFVPTAFHPNSSSRQNKVFSPLIKYCSSSMISIYNVWGELIWQSNDLNAVWDGTYKGEACPQGIYLCCIQIVGESTKKTQLLRQVIQLLR